MAASKKKIVGAVILILSLVVITVVLFATGTIKLPTRGSAPPPGPVCPPGFTTTPAVGSTNYKIIADTTGKIYGLQNAAKTAKCTFNPEGALSCINCVGKKWPDLSGPNCWKGPQGLDWSDHISNTSPVDYSAPKTLMVWDPHFAVAQSANPTTVPQTCW